MRILAKNDIFASLKDSLWSVRHSWRNVQDQSSMRARWDLKE